MLYLSSIVLGTIAGFIGGAFGLAGSVLLVPGLIFMKIIPSYTMAVGTVLFSMLPPISILAVLEYRKRKQINYGIGAILCITTTIAAYFGAYCNRWMSQQFIKYCAAVILLILSLGMFYSGYKELKA